MKTSVGRKIVDRLKTFTEVLEKNEPISDRFTCKKVSLNLQPAKYDPALVKTTRKVLSVSQALFAQFLGVSPKTIRAWEQGVNEPNEMACRFMDEIRGNPDYWIARLKKVAVSKRIEMGGNSPKG